MEREARPEAVEEGGEPVMVYEGHLTNLFRSLEVPNPYYTSVMRALKNGDYAIQLRRGGGSALSKWVLIKAPEEETFREAAERRTARSGKMGILEQRVNDLQRLVKDSNERIERITQMLQERIENLEGQLNGR